MDDDAQSTRPAHELPAATPTAASSRWSDLTVPLAHLVQMAPRWMLVLAAGMLLPHVLRWGLPSLPDGAGAAAAYLALQVLLFVLVYAASVLVHEGLHILAMMTFGAVPPSTIHFRLRLREGIAYVHTDRPMTARAYRGVLVLPGLLLGVVPWVLGLWQGSLWLSLYGFVMLASALGDAAVLYAMRHLDAHTRVRDHPEKVGLQVWRTGA